jgi:hypothetical protein
MKLKECAGLEDLTVVVFRSFRSKPIIAHLTKFIVFHHKCNTFAYFFALQDFFKVLFYLMGMIRWWIFYGRVQASSFFIDSHPISEFYLSEIDNFPRNLALETKSMTHIENKAVNNLFATLFWNYHPRQP